MPEQDIEMQILEELHKLKDIASKVRNAESAYRNSSELFDKIKQENSNLSALKEELNAHSQTTRENLHKIFLIWEQANRKKIDNLNVEIENLKITSPTDYKPQFNEFSGQIKKINADLYSFSEELSILKKKQETNTMYIWIGFVLVFIIGFIVLILK